MNGPALQHVAHFHIDVGVPITIGETGEGLRRVVPITGGRISGPRLNGVILPAGADFQVIRADGYTTLEAKYAARLEDGAMLYIVNIGVRFGPPEVMARITRGEPVDPADVYFRTVPKFETASADHEWLSRKLFIASGARHPDCVQLSVYEVG